MEPSPWIAGAAGAVLAAWTAALLDPHRRFRSAPRLEAAVDLPPAHVIAVVPARDEAAVLPSTLPALLAQGAPSGGSLRVVLADDGSTDGTGGRALQLAADAGAASRLRVVTIPPTPPGWAGKVHAMARGVAEADRWAAEAGLPADRWIWFTDADIRHRPGALADLLARTSAGRGGSGAEGVSVMARLEARGFWERLLLPPFVFFFHLLYPFGRVAGPAGRPAAAGGCNLVRRSALQRAGSLEAIRGEIIDDVALAGKLASSGARLWLGIDDGIVSVRPYGGLGGVWRMVARSAFVQLGRSWGLLVATQAALAAFVVSPPVVVALATWCLLSDGGGAAAFGVAAAGVAWSLQCAALLPWIRHLRVPPGYALALPLAGALYTLMTLSSAWSDLRGRGASWKGRAYSAPPPEAS